MIGNISNNSALIKINISTKVFSLLNYKVEIQN